MTHNGVEFSEKQFKVAALLVRGYSVPRISADTGLDIRQVQSQIKNIYQKTGVSGVHKNISFILWWKGE